MAMHGKCVPRCWLPTLLHSPRALPRQGRDGEIPSIGQTLPLEQAILSGQWGAHGKPGGGQWRASMILVFHATITEMTQY